MSCSPTDDELHPDDYHPCVVCGNDTWSALAIDGDPKVLNYVLQGLGAKDGLDTRAYLEPPRPPVEGLPDVLAIVPVCCDCARRSPFPVDDPGHPAAEVPLIDYQTIGAWTVDRSME